MDFEQIRKLIVTALFSDDVLYEQLVLKGGNAMSLVYGLTSRVSLDLDFSLARDFDDLGEAQRRMERALVARFAPFGFAPFDLRLFPRPTIPGEGAARRWGGYQLEFKLADRRRYGSGIVERERLRREALVVGPNHMKVFSVDFSKWEETVGKTKAEIDNYTIYVYTPAMIAAEKIRAICQQMEEYGLTRKTRRARARDFFDIHAIITKTGFRFGGAGSADLVRQVFAAKEVPLSLLGKIRDQREFHRVDWASVRATVAEELEGFDFYFDFVVEAIEPLHPLWVE